MTDWDLIRWTALAFLTWRGCGIAWKLVAAQLERLRLWVVADLDDDEGTRYFLGRRW